MTFRDLLQENAIWPDTFQLIHIKYEELGDESSMAVTMAEVSEKYTKLIMKLLAYAYNPHDYSIVLSLVPVDAFNDVEYVDVALVDPIKGLTDDLASLPWKEIVDLTIELPSDLGDYSDAQVLSDILWELTTWGFTTDINDQSKDLYSSFLAGFFREGLDRN